MKTITDEQFKTLREAVAFADQEAEYESDQETHLQEALFILDGLPARSKPLNSILKTCAGSSSTKHRHKKGNSHMKILEEIMAEVQRATAKFPTWPTRGLDAIAVLGEEYGELNKEVLQMTYEPHKTSRDEIRKEAVQTAAMAIRFAMSLDVYDYTPTKQHKQDPLP